MVFIGKIW